MLPFLKAPADAPLMTDKHEIDARYRYWRRHLLASAYSADHLAGLRAVLLHA